MKPVHVNPRKPQIVTWLTFINHPDQNCVVETIQGICLIFLLLLISAKNPRVINSEKNWEFAPSRSMTVETATPPMSKLETSHPLRFPDLGPEDPDKAEGEDVSLWQVPQISWLRCDAKLEEAKKMV